MYTFVDIVTSLGVLCVNNCIQCLPVSTMPSHEEVRLEFTQRGLSISEWARTNGFSTALVYQVIAGKRKAVRGQSHRIAIALGLKEGIDADINDLPFVRGGRSARG